MTIWQIEFQSDDPHWSIAFVEANTDIQAKEKLLAILKDEHQRPDTVWKDSEWPIEEWKVSARERPFLFILGAGCR